MVASIRRQRGVEGPLKDHFRFIAFGGTVGVDIYRMLNQSQKSFWVVEVPTGRSAVTPWRNTMLLDPLFFGEEGMSPYNLSVIAHEYIHLLQRDLNYPRYFPSGGLRPGKNKRWIGDSTNYMEVLAYIVSFAIWHDSIENDAKRERIASDLLWLTGYSYDACDFVVDKFPNVGIYQKNHEREMKEPDRRIPFGGWEYWLDQFGMSRLAIMRIGEIVNG